MGILSLEEEKIIKYIRKKTKLGQETKTSKGTALRDIKNLFKHEEKKNL